MNAIDHNRAEQRVLILAPLGRDAVLTQKVLTDAGIASFACGDVDALTSELSHGAGALIMTEEAIAEGDMHRLSAMLSRQPPWSDLPIILAMRKGIDSPLLDQARPLGNVIFVERPIRVAALVSAVRAVLRARQRQYQVRDHLLEQERAAAALQEADRRKDEFLATLAHELRNPLAPIRNAVQILRLGGSSQTVVEQVREILDRQVDHMVRLIDDLMEVSRITRGKIELRKERVELAAVLRSAIETSYPLVEAGAHRLTNEIAGEPLFVDADFVRLAQVFANLINNAAKYMDKGGNIQIRAKRDGATVAVSVRDSGVGIPREMLPRVFDMFTQIHGTETRSQGGLGIGLTVVRSLIEMHGGTVTVSSDGPGKGSEFVVCMPLAEVPTNETAHRQDETSGLAPCRVLVVDDNRDAADSMGLLLESLGANVKVVHDGQSALSLLENFRPTVVLLDIGMPKVDGYEVARRIRARREFQSLKLVALTGWGQAEDRRRTRAAGFDYHLIKPAEINELTALMRSIENGARG